MRQLSTRDVGGEVHHASSAGASVAQAHGAEGISLGTIGTRQADSAPRTRPATAPHHVVVDDAGPCGS